MTRTVRFLGVGAAAAAILAAFFLVPSPCAPIAQETPERGSHGFRIWTGADIRSFTHEPGRTCIPEGWQAVGATHAGRGWATFAPKQTGVIVRSAAFASTTLTSAGNQVVLVYPVSKTSPERRAALMSMATNAFERIGALFPNTRFERPHTVLVTAGLGNTDTEVGSVYPDPGPDATFLILPPEHPRAEELFVHAVAHHYNRFAGTLPSLHSPATEIPNDDWQEVEAAWAETAFESRAATRAARIHYLYGVHEAVMKKDFSLIREAPFDDPEAFATLRPGVSMPPDATYMEEQYGHYVLAPLMMTAVEALLQKYTEGTDLSSLLKRIHASPGTGFFKELSAYLPETEIERVRRFADGEELIPRELVEAGLARYAAHDRLP